jgi:hypothetical protein
MACNTVGGLVVVRPDVINVRPGSAVDLALLSDLHLGSSLTDYDALERELSDAKDREARILINGDVFDAILPSDHKRYSPDAVAPWCRARKDALNCAVEYAVELLAPYVDLIDMVGTGNHDAEMEKRHAFDPVRALVKGLNRLASGDHFVHQGGYTGLVEYRFRHPGHGRLKRYVLWYHHGAGKTGTLSSAVTSLSKKAQWVRADLLWEGHSHTRWSADELVVGWEDGAPRPEVRQVRYVVTGSYLRPYNPQDPVTVEVQGRRGNYISDSGMRPHGVGGAVVVLWFGGPNDPPSVKVVQ